MVQLDRREVVRGNFRCIFWREKNGRPMKQWPTAAFRRQKHHLLLIYPENLDCGSAKRLFPTLSHPVSVVINPTSCCKMEPLWYQPLIYQFMTISRGISSHSGDIMKIQRITFSPANWCLSTHNRLIVLPTSIRHKEELLIELDGNLKKTASINLYDFFDYLWPSYVVFVSVFVTKGSKSHNPGEPFS